MLALVAVALLAMALPSAGRASCAATVEWRGVSYYGFGSYSPTRGRVLGEGQIPACESTDRATSVVIRGIRGIHPSRAVSVAREPNTIYVAEGRSVRFAGRILRAPDLRQDEENPTNWLVAGVISAGALLPLACVLFVRR